MPTGASVIGGLRTGGELSRINQMKKRSEFDMQQQRLGNYESIVGNAAKTLEKFRGEMAIKRAAAKNLEDQALIDQKWQEVFESVTTPLSRTGEKALAAGVPVDVPAQLAQLEPFRQLPDLNAQAVVAAQGAGMKKGIEEKIITDENIREAQETQELALEQIRERGRQQQITKGIISKQDITTTDLTVRTQGALQEDFIGDANRIARLQTIRSQILDNPQFLQFAGKMGASVLNKLDKIGIPLTEGGKEFLTEQTQFVRDSIENINSYIKEITGAQMSEKEATRLRLAQPDPGEDILSGDGPTKFLAKADGALKAAMLSQARSAYFLEKGIAHDFQGEAEKAAQGLPEKQPPVTLAGMKQIINEKGKEQAMIIKANNPDMPNDEVLERAREIVQRRYGMIQ